MKNQRLAVYGKFLIITGSSRLGTIGTPRAYPPVAAGRHFPPSFPRATIMPAQTAPASITQTLPASAFKSPLIALSGVVDYEMYEKFRKQFDHACDQDLVVIELSTLGGDPEVARMMGEDVRFASEMEQARRFVFLGKAAIYSAGTTFMSFFARQNRYLTRGTRLMIHERKLAKNLVIDGPLTTCLATVQATLNEIECSIAIQNEGFQNLVVGSSVSLDEVLKRAPSNWYLEAEEARNLGLIEAVL
jgi:ATP-dependent protease ClpP protease subunit